MSRIYVRCTTCLEPCSLEDTIKYREATCGACGGKFEFMGFIRGFEVVEVSLRCVFDERCVNALGPSCECACEGKNHGAGMFGYVETVKEVGKVRITPINKARAEARAKEYLAELALAYVKVKGLQGWEHLSGMSKIKRAVDSRQHNHRMDILCNINGHAYISTLQKDREKSKVEASDI